MESKLCVITWATNLFRIELSFGLVKKLRGYLSWGFIITKLCEKVEGRKISRLFEAFMEVEIILAGPCKQP